MNDIPIILKGISTGGDITSTEAQRLKKKDFTKLQVNENEPKKKKVSSITRLLSKCQSTVKNPAERKGDDSGPRVTTFHLPTQCSSYVK